MLQISRARLPFDTVDKYNHNSLSAVTEGEREYFKQVNDDTVESLTKALYF